MFVLTLLQFLLLNQNPRSLLRGCELPNPSIGNVQTSLELSRVFFYS